MKSKYLMAILLVSQGLGILVAPAWAEPSCTAWMRQADGSDFRTCVGDDGKQYCESSKNGQISRVSCSG